DLITAERQAKNNIYLNDGKQNFSRPKGFGDEADETRSIEIADIDKDGFLDVLAGNLGQKNAIYFGDRDLSFNRKFTFKEARMTSSVAIADLNKDGNSDVVEGNTGQANYVHLGKPDGTFTEMELGEDVKQSTYNVRTGDLNNDGFSDIVESNSGGLNLFYITRKKS
ncbi:MAG: VCBS repeat-containing protein, partial [Pyrinomonadaceae bacterium]